VSELELALVENLQREDLDPIEAAHGFRRLIDEFGSRHEHRATRSAGPLDGRQHLRLLDLAPVVQAAIADGSITEGHGGRSAVLPSSTRSTSSARSIDQELSVRQTGGARPSAARAEAPERRPRPTPRRDPDLETRRGGPAASPRHQGQPGALAARGRIVIEYYSDEELGRLYDRLTGGTA
jgi:ParB family chromosome partitioning protein